MNSVDKQLMADVPWMRCANMGEFRHRLGYLAEGMLRNHMENIRNYTIDQREIEIYQRFKVERDAYLAAKREERKKA